MEFCSEEYLRAVVRRINSSSVIRWVERPLSFTLILEAEPEKGVFKDIVIGYVVEDGRISEFWRGYRESDFVISGKYGVWVMMLLGRLSPIKAILTRRLKVRGRLGLLLKYLDLIDFAEVLEVMREVPASFHGDYSKYSLKGG